MNDMPCARKNIELDLFFLCENFQQQQSTNQI